MKERSKELSSLAALPMYDFPELAWATDALWAAIAARLGVSAPLVRNCDLHSVWTDPTLLLAQTCGYPLVTSLCNKVTVVCTPCYRAPGCEGPLYRSVIVVRRDDTARRLEDFRGRRCAVNEMSSNSGMNMLRAEIAPLSQGGRFFSKTVMTGAHTASAAAVCNCFADVAAIDCVTWAHLKHLRPAITKGLRVLAWTAPSPGLPLITSGPLGATARVALMQALDDVVRDSALETARNALLLNGFKQMPHDAYAAIIALEQQAIAAGYPVLR